MSAGSEPPVSWSESNSQDFLNYGRYFVPDRERQLQILAGLVQPIARPLHVIELGCGEGLLAEAVLERFPYSVVHALDGSDEMLARARKRLERFGERVDLRPFDLFSREWRRPPWPVHAVLSSLAVHHLDAAAKQLLFRDLYEILAFEGRLILADILQPADRPGLALAAQEYDAAVRQRAIQLDGNEAAFQFFQREGWNLFRHPDPAMDRPSPLADQLRWLAAAGFGAVDVYWMQAGHAIYGGRKFGPVRPVPASATRPLRLKVLRPGQPPENAHYPGDEAPDTFHAGVYEDDRLVAAASIFHEPPPGEQDPGAWRLRGVAVDPAAQRRGYGRSVVLACLDHVASQGGTRLWCNARAGALDFYLSLGFRSLGERFETSDGHAGFRMAFEPVV